jgi:hypothetical protein
MATVYRPFHRITKHDPPEREDFMSSAARGDPAPDDDPQRAALHDGISTFATEQQARKKVLGMRERGHNLGDYIARLEIPDDAPGVRIERTLRTPGHHTIWADPDELLKCVVSIVPV